MTQSFSYWREDKPGVAATIFKPLSKNSINVDMVVQNISANGKDRSNIYN